MPDNTARPKVQEQPGLMIFLGCYAIFGCAVFALSILIADFVVPDHDWIADTISDLGAGKYEFIVDIGIYAFSSALICVALLTAHVHLGGLRWSVSIVGLVALGLIVFLVGARNEYGDSDKDGVVIHRYLVYGLGFLMASLPLLMAKAAGRADPLYSKILVAISVVWVPSAPIFFFLPDAIDGVYERYLGLISFVFVITLSHLFIQRGRSQKAAKRRREAKNASA